MKHVCAHRFQVASHVIESVPCARIIGEDVVGAEVGILGVAEGVGVFLADVGLEAADGETPGG